MTTFNELAATLKNNPVLDNNFDTTATTLWNANRHYMDDGKEGNYLKDFLLLHGHKEICAIKFIPGSPVSAGAGIVFT